MIVPPTPVAPTPDLAARFALLIERLIHEITVAAAGRWGLAPLVVWVVRPYLRHLCREFGAVVANSRHSVTVPPATARRDPLPADVAPPRVARPEPSRTSTFRAVPRIEPAATQPTERRDPPTAISLKPGRPPAQGERADQRRHADRPPIYLETRRSACGKPTLWHAQNVTLSRQVRHALGGCHARWMGSIHSTVSGFSTGSISRLTTTASLSLRTSTHSNTSSRLALIS